MLGFSISYLSTFQQIFVMRVYCQKLSDHLLDRNLIVGFRLLGQHYFGGLQKKNVLFICQF